MTEAIHTDNGFLREKFKVTAEEQLAICEEVSQHIRDTAEEWPWQFFLIFPTIATGDASDEHLGRPIRIIQAWWFRIIQGELWGSYINVDAESTYEVARGLAFEIPDLLAYQCKETIERWNDD